MRETATAEQETKKGYKKTKLGWIPEEWQMKALREISKIKRGRFSPRPRNDPKYFGGLIPFVQTGEVTTSNGRIKTYSQTLNEEGLAVSQLFKEGTILITIAANIGYTAILEIDMACPDSLIGIICNELVLNEFLNYSFIKKQKYIEYLAPAGAQKNINIEVLSPLKIILPPLPEQKAIATCLNTWDTAITQLNKLFEAKQTQKQGLMQQLLSGKKRLPGFSGNWKRLKFEDVLKMAKRPVEWSDEELYELISVRRRSGGLFHRDSLYGHQILTKKLYTAKKGDFLMSKMQILHGASGLVTDEFDNMKISGSYIAVTPKNSKILDMNFLNWYSKTPLFYHQTYRSSYGVHIEKMTFNYQLFKKEELRLPLKKEQTAITEILNTADHEITLLKKKLKNLKLQKKGVMQQLLTGKKRLNH
jgi:type I restriction enzyme S subunit